MHNSARLIAARDLLLRLREDLTAAGREFQWPRFEEFNWALDYFDVIARDNHNLALRVVSSGGAEESLTFAQLARRSSQVANFLAAQGVGRGDRILIMLANVVPLWETMLAAIKLGAVIIPATTLLERTELLDRLERGRVGVVVTTANLAERFEGLGTATVRIAVARGERAGCLTINPTRRVSTSKPRPRRAPTTCYFSTSPPGPRPDRSWWRTRTRAIRSDICRQCIGSVCSPGTCT